MNAQANSGIVTPVDVQLQCARPATAELPRDQHVGRRRTALSPAPITQGGQATGKVYFDVTGAPPTGVVYNDGVQDVLVWTTASAPNGAPGQAPGQMPSPMPGPGCQPGA